jgi:hypothetical protein
MERYFFDIRDEDDFPDLQGSECPNLAAARNEARRCAAEVRDEMPERFGACREWTMIVSDHQRKPLFTLQF